MWNYIIFYLQYVMLTFTYSISMCIIFISNICLQEINVYILLIMFYLYKYKKKFFISNKWISAYFMWNYDLSPICTLYIPFQCILYSISNIYLQTFMYTYYLQHVCTINILYIVSIINYIISPICDLLKKK